jgi:5-methylcytosine-specific restriction endonuclease McrA
MNIIVNIFNSNNREYYIKEAAKLLKLPYTKTTKATVKTTINKVVANTGAGKFNVDINNSNVKPKASKDDKEQEGLKKPRRKQIPAPLRSKLWRIHFNKSMDGNCYVCQAEIAFEAWEAGHIISDAEGGAISLENLKPCCIQCNRSMGKVNMNDFIIQYFPNRAKELRLK